MTKSGARTVAEFCKDYRVGKTSVYKLNKLGRLRIVKVGKRSLILDEDAERFTQSLVAKRA